MFTGIVECLGIVTRIEKDGSNINLWVKSPISQELKIDQSVSHNGACLTVVALQDDVHKVTIIAESLDKTNLAELEVGQLVNLERSMRLSDRLDGHLVQGHVDQVGRCLDIENKVGSWVYTIQYQPHENFLLVEKGSICVNGISLTCHSLTENTFKVSIIPYTHEHTNMKWVEKNSIVNLEFDIIGKLIAKKTTYFNK